MTLRGIPVVMGEPDDVEVYIIDPEQTEAVEAFAMALSGEETQPHWAELVKPAAEE